MKNEILNSPVEFAAFVSAVIGRDVASDDPNTWAGPLSLDSLEVILVALALEAEIFGFQYPFDVNHPALALEDIFQVTRAQVEGRR